MTKKANKDFAIRRRQLIKNAQIFEANITYEELYKLAIIEKKSNKELAILFDVSTKEIQKILAKLKISRLNRNHINMSKEELYDLFIVKDFSIQEIADLKQEQSFHIFYLLQKYNLRKPKQKSHEIISKILSRDTLEKEIYINELTGLQIANKYKINYNALLKYMKSLHLKSRLSIEEKLNIDIEELRKLYVEDNYSICKLCEYYNVSENTIYWLLEKYSIIKPVKKRLELTYKTKEKRYNNRFYNNQEKCDKTHYERYGSKRATHLPEVQAKMKATNLERRGYENAAQDPEVRKKMIQTSIANGTCGNQISKWEQSLVDRIREAFPEYTIVQQYKEERYPYLCDCYIKELDLFIEFNGSFYHNYRPFVESVEMIEEYDDMVARSELLENIANKWRYIDPEKRCIAEMNNLNFIEYWEDSTEDIVELIERYTHKNL